ncbi:hypothetical protein [Streptomyces indicus]|uniref:Uncharacterized protein n=1 Tax=Streptomyces indicus TaxID=417292 RepID=A0A1G9A8R1_9ACTN|nr:hypothetical protein [Streptomyces indicus]SDK23746.1 hypothetical protein SAMN05421806_105432 [Streptomyces indicus]
MKFETLFNGNFASLGDAVDDWSTVVKSLKELEKEAREDLKAKAYKANWAGVNATVSREFITKTVGEFKDALTQATSIRNILKDARDELVSHRDELRQIIQRGANKNLTVTATGDGGFAVTMLVHPDRAGKGVETPDHSEQDAVNLRDEVQRILNKATESDTSADKVLRALADQAKYGFSGASYKDRDSAAEALKAADAMARLAKNGQDMSAKELAEFNRTLGTYRNDELFAARFASKLGGKETLQLWTDLTTEHAGVRGAELKEMQELQKNLSMTLATATYSDSSGMAQWKKEVINETNTAFRTTSPDVYRSSPYGLQGYQVMSSLMGAGKYDTEFLDSYGKKLIKVDMAPAGSPGMGTNDLWVNSQQGDPTFGKGDGRDPLVGFMKALSHNPEAATNAFADRDVVEHIMHSAQYTDRDSAVGAALESAVTGIADGQHSPALPHSREQGEVMKSVMHAVAQPDTGAALVGNTELGEHLGNMASAYMPEISRTLSGNGTESVFVSDTAATDFGRTDTSRFLYEVARDPEGRAGIVLGETIYTSSLIEAHVKDPSLHDGDTEQALGMIAKNSGIVEGIVGHSLADLKIEGDLGSEKEYNEALKEKGDVVKTFLAAGVGVGTVALVPAGAGAALVGAAVSGFAGGVVNLAIDRIIEGQEMSGALDRALYQSGLELDDSLSSATQQAQAATLDSIEKHDSDLKGEAMSVLIADQLNNGWRDSDGILEDAHVRPSS